MAAQRLAIVEALHDRGLTGGVARANKPDQKAEIGPFAREIVPRERVHALDAGIKIRSRDGGHEHDFEGIQLERTGGACEAAGGVDEPRGDCSFGRRDALVGFPRVAVWDVSAEQSNHLGRGDREW